MCFHVLTFALSQGSCLNMRLPGSVQISSEGLVKANVNTMK